MIKKMSLITFGGILLFVLIVFTLNYFDNKKNSKELTKRKFLYEIKEQKNWKVIKITKKSSLSQFDDPYNLNLDGNIFYDTVYKHLYVEVTDWNTSFSRNVDDEHKEWIEFDTLGKIIRNGKFDNLKQIHLKPILPLDIEETKSEFYIAKYIKGKTNWDAFNPLRGMGNPNGTRENIYSDGFAFINLVVKNDTLKFKTEANQGEFDINTKIFLYSFNAKNINSTSFKIIEIDSYNEENGLYLLYPKIK